jgi:cytochrome oxidase Cu insertion factor (SCO1/SenC/PrrC family)
VPGMNSGLTDSNPTLVAAFKTALLHQGFAAVVLLAVLALIWLSVRDCLPAGRPAARAGPARRIRERAAEPAARRLLRIGFGILWIFDGLLQAQPAMAAGLPAQVIEPSAATSPLWIQHLVNWAGTTWSFHPIQASASVVWIQVGIGAWLIAASSGRLSRLGGLASAGWGLVIWVFGESFGGIFGPGLTVLFGAPGAAFLYFIAGVLVGLPERCWSTAQAGRRIIDGIGLFFVGGAVLEAWPGRGFWQGTLHGKPASLTSMIHSMSGTPQPWFLAAWVRGFATLVAAHGFTVNLVAVTALATIGVGLLSRQPRLIRITLILMITACLADWVLVEDLGFFGGLGTDPNSMIPLALLAIGGYLALTRVPAAATEPAVAPVPAAVPEPVQAREPAGAVASAGAGPPEPGGQQPPGRDRGWPARLAPAVAAASMRSVVAVWAAVVVIVGAAPMAMAQVNPNADPIIARAIAGAYAPLDVAAPGFRLTDQSGGPVSLASLRGKVVLLTFLDPVCTSDCPLIAQEFREADQVLGPRSRDVELVAIVANPLYRDLAYTRAFDWQEGLSGVRNWLYLTGPLAQLRRAWHSYGIVADSVPAGGMVAHSDVAYVIDARGHTRAELDFDPGPGTSSSVSSFAVELTNAARLAMRSS